MWLMAVVGPAPCQCRSPGEPDHVAGADLLDGATLALDPAAARGDDQRLPERVRVPGRAGAGLEGDQGPARPGRLGRAEQRVDPDGAGEPVLWALARGREPARMISMAVFLECLATVTADGAVVVRAGT